MTNEPKLRLVLDREKELRDLNEWNTALKEEGRPELAEKARNSLDSYVLRIANEMEGINIESAEDLTDDVRKNALNFASHRATAEASKTLYDNRKAIVYEVPKSSLEEMVGENGKIFLEEAEPKDREALRAFANYKALERLAEDYKKGEVDERAKENKDLIADARGRGAVKATEKKLKGYDETTRELAKALVYVAAKQGLVAEGEERNYIMAGMKEIAADEKKKAEKAGDFYKAARSVLLKLAESKDAKKFNAARGLIAGYVDAKDVEKEYRAAA